jgi:hypothetical protein
MSVLLMIAAASLALAFVFGGVGVRSWFKRRAAAAGEIVEDAGDEISRAWHKYAPDWDDADKLINDAHKYWPYLAGDKRRDIKGEPLFMVGVVTSSILVCFAVAGGWAVAGGNLFYGVLLGVVFGAVNILQAFVSVTGDKGKGDFWELKRADRTAGSHALLGLILCLNFFAGFIGSSVVGEGRATASKITAGSVQAQIQERKNLKDQIALSVSKRKAAGLGGMGADELAKAAKDQKEAAICESYLSRSNSLCPQDKVKAGVWGPKCGDNCQTKKAEAARLDQYAKAAAAEDDAEQRIAVLNEKLEGRGYVTEEGNPAGQRFSELTWGIGSADQFEKWSLMILLWVVSIIDYLVWLKIGDRVASARINEINRRREGVVAAFANNNETLPERFTAKAYDPTSDPVALPSPVVGGDTVTIAVGEDPQAKIKASERLRDIDQFFSDVMVEADGSAVAFGKLYDIYANLKASRNHKTWLNRSDFRNALTDYAELLNLEVVAMKLHGYKVGFTPDSDLVEEVE